MKKSPAFQFYAKDWLSSSTIALMPPEYEGAYIRLLAYCWDSGDCSLPDDDELLSRLSRLFEGWFKGGSTVVRKCFIPHPNRAGFLTNKRLLEEAQKQAAWREKSAKGGKKSSKQGIKKQKDYKGGSRVVEECLQPNGNIASSFASSFTEKREREDNTQGDGNEVRKKASRLTLDAPPPEWIDFCKQQRPDLNPQIVFEMFADFWRAKPGKDGTKLDWFATWKNWVRREKANPSAVKPVFEPKTNKIVL